MYKQLSLEKITNIILLIIFRFVPFTLLGHLVPQNAYLY